MANILKLDLWPVFKLKCCGYFVSSWAKEHKNASDFKYKYSKSIFYQADHFKNHGNKWYSPQ